MGRNVAGGRVPGLLDPDLIADFHAEKFSAHFRRRPVGFHEGNPVRRLAETIEQELWNGVAVCSAASSG